MLDHTAFPFVVDLILSYAPWPGLLAFRATSSDFRDKIDKSILGKHLLFSPVGSSQYGMSVRGSNGHHHPAFAVWSPEWNADADEDDDGMDTYPDIPEVVPLEDPSHSVSVAMAALSIDLAEEMPFITLASFARLFEESGKPVPYLRTLRNPSPYPYYQALLRPATQVAFISYPGPGFRGSVARSAQKFVVHVQVDALYVSGENPLFVWNPVRGTETVLIFEPKPGVVESCQEQAPPDLNTFSHLISTLAEAPLTIVGLTELAPAHWHDGGSAEDVKDTFKEFMYGWLQENDTAGGLIAQLAKDNLTLLTLEQYRETLSPEDFALETIEDIREIPRRFDRTYYRDTK